MNIDIRINLLRNEMRKHGLDAYIIPTNDPHQSEYVADHWKSREWISGFTGSAGTVVITQNHAGLWTDSRYFIQAEEELSSSSMVMHKIKVQHMPQHIDWIRQHLPKGSTIGIDGNLVSQGNLDRYQKILKPEGISINTAHDLIAAVWEDRPALPDDTVFIHDVQYAGLSYQDKAALIRDKMKEDHIDHLLITALDEIAWLFNLRGRDVDYNPVFVSYAILSQDHAQLYINPDKIDDAVYAYLKDNDVKTRPYDTIIKDLNNISEKDRIMLAPFQVCSTLYRAINGEIAKGESYVKVEKAIKNPTEQKHIRNVMKRDGAALAHVFYWLEHALKERTVSEVELSDKLAECRKAQGKYFGESFGAIVGYKGNGAIVHYRPLPGKCADIKAEGILLVDSGGQYEDGTTDITRTLSLSAPTQEQKRNFTLVLKGHIALAQARFPKGTTGQQLDTFARQYLWDAGLDYGHGTGHGVGFFLNVHEGPQGFAPNASERGKTAHLPGMYTSNEPGYYKTNEYGIRTENLVITQKSKNGEFLHFETVTLYPIDLRLIDENIMTKSEKAWLNRYHARVYKEVVPLLDDDNLKSWFKIKCRPLN